MFFPLGCPGTRWTTPVQGWTGVWVRWGAALGLSQHLPLDTEPVGHWAVPPKHQQGRIQAPDTFLPCKVAQEEQEPAACSSLILGIIT